MGQLITFCFIPFGSWLARSFLAGLSPLPSLPDIWKPFPIRDVRVLPGGLGICADDDIVAGVYAGICLAVSLRDYTRNMIYHVLRRLNKTERIPNEPEYRRRGNSLPRKMSCRW